MSRWMPADAFRKDRLAFMSRARNAQWYAQHIEASPLSAALWQQSAREAVNHARVSNRGMVRILRAQRVRLSA